MSGSGTPPLVQWLAGAVLATAIVAGGAWLFARFGMDQPGEATTLAALPQSQEAGGTQPSAPADTDAPAPGETVAPDTADTAAAPDEAANTAGPPRLDEVRVEADGLTVIAGRASPFAQVILRAGGIEVARTAADGSGSFATVAILDPSTEARLLTLSELDASGGEILSPDELILAPVRSAPADVAQGQAPQPEDVAADTAQDTSGTAAEGGTVEEMAALQPDTDETAPARPADAVDTADPGTDPAAAPSEPQDTASAGATAGAPAPDEPATDMTATSTTAQTDPAPSGQVAVLRPTEDGVEVVQAPLPAPDVMSQVALDTISYSDAGDVQLTGRAQDAAREVRVYLDNRVIAALDVDDTGNWRGNLPDIDTGVYTLRVDEVDAAGKVTSRVETPFKREDPQVLEAATKPGDAPVKAVTVQKGATLWAIARERYGSGVLYVRVFDANRDTIRNPDLIYPGQVFSLPDE